MTVKKKQPSNWKVITLTAVLVGSLVGSVVYLLIDRHQHHKYICHIEGYDPESNMIGMECMYK